MSPPILRLRPGTTVALRPLTLRPGADMPLRALVVGIVQQSQGFKWCAASEAVAIISAALWFLPTSDSHREEPPGVFLEVVVPLLTSLPRFLSSFTPPLALPPPPFPLLGEELFRTRVGDAPDCCCLCLGRNVPFPTNPGLAGEELSADPGRSSPIPPRLLDPVKDISLKDVDC